MNCFYMVYYSLDIFNGEQKCMQAITNLHFFSLFDNPLYRKGTAISWDVIPHVLSICRNGIVFSAGLWYDADN